MSALTRGKFDFLIFTIMPPLFYLHLDHWDQSIVWLRLVPSSHMGIGSHVNHTLYIYSYIKISTWIFIKIEFYFFEGETTNVTYLYKKRGHYYIEQPYIGIWKTTPESYDNIVELLNI